MDVVHQEFLGCRITLQYCLIKYLPNVIMDFWAFEYFSFSIFKFLKTSTVITVYCVRLMIADLIPQIRDFS